MYQEQFVKTIDSNSWGWTDGPSVRIFQPQDVDSFVKRAGAEFATFLKKMSFDKGLQPVHIMAVGATEFYGPNRNGDGFKCATCKARHHTFVSNARYYLHHKHNDPKKSYGHVKHSHYSPSMHRIELLAMLNMTKEACDKYGGMIDEEGLQKLASGEDIPTSMSCAIAYDVCQCCGNRARKRAEYCTARTCPGGGCAENLGGFSKDGSGDVLFVDNVDPTYFDISRVGHQADRISYGARVKAAEVQNFMRAIAEGHPVSGAFMADLYGISAPASALMECNPLIRSCVRAATHCMEKAAKLDMNLRTKRASGLRMPPNLEGLNQPTSKADWKKLAFALAENRIVLPMYDYLCAVVGPEKSANVMGAVYERMPGVYGRMLGDGTALHYLSEDVFGLFQPQGESIKYASEARNYRDEYSLDPNLARRRDTRYTIQNGELVKTASMREEAPEQTVESQAEKLARKYAAYRITAAMVTYEKADFDGFLKNLVRED